jgi:hypothetical protein
MILIVLWLGLTAFLPGAVSKDREKRETMDQVRSRLADETLRAYESSPFSAFSKDYFNRFHLNPEEKPAADDLEIGKNWRILLPAGSGPLTRLMAGQLKEFLARCMLRDLPVEDTSMDVVPRAIVLSGRGGGVPDAPGSFTIAAGESFVTVRGLDESALRDGVVKLVERLGLRRAPILHKGEQVFRPRLAVRLGAVPFLGSTRDLVFMGYNAALVGGGNLHALSTSEAIPELKARRQPEVLARGVREAAAARRFGLRTYSLVNTQQKFAPSDPVFRAHPEIRGAVTWKADGDSVLCTEHPLVRRYLAESVEGIFRADPGLDGLVVIIGGEGFYHCFMRPYGVAKGHTNCPRCEKLGAETVVANLLNLLAGAARRVNPRAEIVAWPYSAEFVWSADRFQEGMIRRMKPGTALLTEIEKDEHLLKAEGVDKNIWDYSIDLIGPGARARRQIEACRTAGIPAYLKSEPELAFEAPRLPYIPCLDRWLDRAEALASSGASGAWVFPAFRPCYGTSSAEVGKLLWWEPAEAKEQLLLKLAARICGSVAAPHLRQAWKLVSEAVDWSPELPSYYWGPYYLGPAHPMCADPTAKLPSLFYGRYLFHAEITDAEGLKFEPTFVVSPTGNVPVFGRFYRRMEGLLKRAADEIAAAEPLVNPVDRLTFEAEASPLRWFYHTARAEANFYESCQLRDRLLAFAKRPPSEKTAAEIAQMRPVYERWRAVLLDEKANAAEALPVMEKDMRLDFYYGGDHTFSHGSEMIRAKLEILDKEIGEFLPLLGRRCGFPE